MHPRSPMTNQDETLPLEASCPEIRALFTYWQTIHPDRGLPGRQHFDPLDVPSLLPHVWLIDVHRSPWRFRFRLAGTAIVDFLGRENTGKWCEEVYEDFENTDAYRYMLNCAETGRPMYRTGKLLSRPDRTYIRAQRLHLPLAADGETTDIILSMTRYLPMGSA